MDWNRTTREFYDKEYELNEMVVPWGGFLSSVAKFLNLRQDQQTHHSTAHQTLSASPIVPVCIGGTVFYSTRILPSFGLPHIANLYRI